MKALLAALRSPAYWRKGFSAGRVISALLASFGGMWLGAEILSFFSPTAGDWLRGQWVAFLVAGTAIAAWQNRPRTRFSCRLAGRDVTIEVRVGDMFALPGAFVIGSNTTFDTELETGLISKRSVQGQFTLAFYDSVKHLDSDLASALVGIASETASAGKIGKTAVYPIGTTIRVAAKSRRAYFLALAEINHHGVAQATFDDLKNSLPKLWDYIATKGGDFGPIVMPVLGSGFSRLPQRRDEIIREIVKSFVAACSSYRPTEALTIVVPFGDFYDHELDLIELEAYVRHVCRYTEYLPPGASGTGKALL